MSAPEPSAAYRRYVLGVLIVVYAINFIDRQILSTLIQPIKAELGASDTALGFLTGAAFAIFYTIAGLPIARWADVGVRRSIIALGLAVWSGLTALSGFAQTFAQLAAARVGVGIGEAALSPPAHSLLSDYFPKERRATALSLYSMGIFIGILFAYLLGGRLSAAIGWRYTLIAVGAPGVLLALLVRFTIREPARTASTTAPAQDAAEHGAFLAVLGRLWRAPGFAYACVGSAAASVSGYAIHIWTFAFFQRVHETPRADLGLYLGLAFGVGGGLGAFLGGVITDRRAAAARARGAKGAEWMLLVPAGAMLVTAPLAWAFLHAPAALAPWLVAAYAVTSAMYLGPVFSAAQSIARPENRAMASAVLLFVLNLFGYGMGPWLAGALADHAFASHATHALRPALSTVSAFCFVAAALFWVGSRRMRS